jgi:hypothetical protein
LINHKIFILEQTTGKEFFDTNGVELEATLSIRPLCDILEKMFKLEQPISKKLYEEMKFIFSHKQNLTINELIDLLEEKEEEQN